ncbi:uridylate-specific endoribonuclease D-like isoform X2 [Calonectris borealis]|uniref:uridylate-specific endoribonuclease D-like isoform X2 n=1 Tax=Calonectris borealis TaxID=1323832 RepID=UPI003F4BBE38
MAAALGLLWLLAFAGAGGNGGPSLASPLPGQRRDAAPVADSVSEQELRDLSEQLYGADVNRAGSGDIVLHLQHRVTADEAGAGTDYAAQRLFSYVAEERLFSQPTFSRFLALLDNYEEVTGHDETVTAEEEDEEEAFLDAVFQTRVMATLTSFFLAKGLYPSEEAFRADLKEMWFGLYSRSGGKALDSSGFEHVFHVGHLPRRPGPAVPLERVSQEHRLHLHGLQPRIRPGPLHPLLQDPSRPPVPREPGGQSRHHPDLLLGQLLLRGQPALRSLLVPPQPLSPPTQ